MLLFVTLINKKGVKNFTPEQIFAAQFQGDDNFFG